MALPIKKLAADLLRLEINTIVTENLSGSKPNNFRRLLFDLAEDYRLRVARYDTMFKGSSSFATQNTEIKMEGISNLNGGQQAYQELVKTSERLVGVFSEKIEKMPDGAEKERERSRMILMIRIYEQSRLILDIFRQLHEEADAHLAAGGTNDPETYPNLLWDNDYSLPQIEKIKDYDLTPDQMGVIRKAYEIGTQYILLQTAVQIEGDITTYVTTKFLEMPLAEQEILLKMHDTATNTSIRLWQYLFQTIGSLIEGLGGSVLAKKKPAAAVTGGGGFFSRLFKRG
jgi:hypothetical protein